MSRIQRLGIGNGGINCEISYMQAKKYPNATEIIKPVEGVSNRTLLKNPFNTLSVSVPQPGERPLRITTDNRGNVFARSETMLVKGVTNDTLLKNPYNIKSVAASEKRTLTLQRIKDINSKALPNFITENKGINEVMLQVLTMIENKQVKLITIQLLKILITKNVPVNSAHTEQKFLQALNLLDTVLTVGRRIFKENTLSPTNIATALRPAIMTYVSEIIKLYNINANVEPANIDTEIQTGIAELGLMSNALTRMFEYANAVEPSNTLSRDQINSAAYTGFGQVGQVVQPVQPVLPVQPFRPIPVNNSLQLNVDDFIAKIDENEGDFDALMNNIDPTKKNIFNSQLADEAKAVEELFATTRASLGDPMLNNNKLEQIINDYNEIIVSDEYTSLITSLINIQNPQAGQPIRRPVPSPFNPPSTPVRPPPFNPDVVPFNPGDVPLQPPPVNPFFFPQPQAGQGRKNRQPKNSKVVFQVGKATQYRKY